MSKEEIGTMLDALTGVTPSDDNEEEIEDINEEDLEPVDPDPEDEEDPDPDDSDDPPSDDDDEDPPPDELTLLKKDHEELKAKFDALAAQPPKAPETTDEDDSDDDPPAITPVDFTKDIEDLEDLVHDREAFNKVLNNLYEGAITTAREEFQKLSQTTMEKMPEIINTSITTKEELQSLTDDFYSNNKDLEGFKKVVGVVYGELSETHPDKSYSEVLELTGKETRKRLGLKKSKTPPTDDQDDPPPLPRKKGTRVKPKTKTERSGVSSEIDDMNEALNN